MKTVALNNINFDIESLQLNEKFFENCIDLIPARIYLNVEDRKQWFNLLNKEIDNDADDEEDDEEDEDENNNNQIKRSRFDPIYYKTVSQIYKELEKCKKLNKPINFQNMKNTQHQKVRKAAGDTDGDEDKKKVKLENKNQSSGAGGAGAEESKKAKQKNLSKKQQEKKEKRKIENNLELTQSSGDDTVAKGNVVAKKKPILNNNGEIVYSKFDFSVDGVNGAKNGKANKKHSKINAHSNVKPKDYKVLVKKLQEKKEKLTKLKETEPEKAFEMETSDKWRTVLDKASGVKVKDDIDMLKKSIKRVEKKKEKTKKEWTDRVQKVEFSKQKAIEKRQKNIDVRKDKKKEKKVKRLKKKGRLLPGF
jgi:hypothetical protein